MGTSSKSRSITSNPAVTLAVLPYTVVVLLVTELVDWKPVMKLKAGSGIWLVCAALAVLSACAARTKTVPSAGFESRDVITASELSEVDAIDAYTAVQQLRPLWLRARGATSLSEPRGTLPTVYADNIRLGDVVTLQAIPIAEVREIRYLSGADATTRWGTGVVGGVIEVIRKKEFKKG